MSFLLPKEFQNILEDLKHSRNFNLIRSTIKKIWGVQAIKKENPYTPFYRKLLTIEHHYPIQSGYNVYSGTYQDVFDGLLTYEKKLNRLVVFQFKQKFDYNEITEELDYWLSYSLERNLCSIGLNEKFISGIKNKKINFSLTKLIVICFDIPTSELLKYLNQTSTSNRLLKFCVELWKITPVGKEIILLEKIQNDFIEDINYCKKEYTENDYFKLSKLNTRIQKKYFLFKECLKFNFTCRLETRFWIDYDKLFKFYEDTLGVQWIDPGYDEGPIDLSSIELVQTFIDETIEEYKQNNIEQGDILSKLKGIDFCFLSIVVYTRGLDYNLELKFKVENNLLKVTISTFEGEEFPRFPINIYEFNITIKTTIEEIDDFIKSIFNKNNVGKKKKKLKGKEDKLDISFKDLPF